MEGKKAFGLGWVGLVWLGLVLPVKSCHYEHNQKRKRAQDNPAEVGATLFIVLIGRRHLWKVNKGGSCDWMMDLVSSCKILHGNSSGSFILPKGWSEKDKLQYFRIKELKDVLTQLGLSKQGKKQENFKGANRIQAPFGGGFLTWLRLVLRLPAFCVTTGEVSTGDPVAGDLLRHSRVVFSQICSSPSGFYRSEASTEVSGTFCCSRWGSCRSHCCLRLFQSPESSWSSNFRFFPSQKRRLKCYRASLLRLISLRGGCKRFVAIENKFFDLDIVGNVEDVLKISENGRGRRTSLLLLENLSVINKGKKNFVIFTAGWNEKGGAKIFDALTEIVNLAFLGTSGALRRPPHQATLHMVLCPHLCLLLHLRAVAQNVVLLGNQNVSFVWSHTLL
ncbi:hypothetical protein Cgig2_021661 [Carnegiea gigantea]|uniref:SAP domain-containing protein n=1 Tax=Carnegiea gigantea TaxID=171969 RepID=A0A9Q1QF93_9CARY|nr:hypothetical protein Cgig2_021661 [Carnegiea gigantea]